MGEMGRMGGSGHGDLGERATVAKVLREDGERVRETIEPVGPTVEASAQAKRVDVRGFVGMTRAEKAKVTGFSAVTLGGRTKMTGWAPFIATRGQVKLKKAANLVAVAGEQVKVGDHGYVGVAISPKVEVRDGGRVFITPLVAIIAGLAVGSGFGLVILAGYLLLSRRGPLARMRARRFARTGIIGTLGGRRFVSGPVAGELSRAYGKAQKAYGRAEKAYGEAYGRAEKAYGRAEKTYGSAYGRTRKAIQHAMRS